MLEPTTALSASPASPSGAATTNPSATPDRLLRVSGSGYPATDTASGTPAAETMSDSRSFFEKVSLSFQLLGPGTLMYAIFSGIKSSGRGGREPISYWSFLRHALKEIWNS